MTRVSVVMPMRNAEAYVQEALRSILQETAQALEVVVVDDGSADRSRTLVAALGDSRVRVVDGPQRGISACLNAGLAAASGDIVMRCDADDLYPAGRIRAQVEWLQARPEIGAVCAGFATIDAQGRPVAELVTARHPEPEDLQDELGRGITRTHLCTYAIRRDVLGPVQGFREYFETGEDLDFQFRLAEHCRVVYLPMQAYLYRLHAASVTHTQRERRRVFFEDMARAFQAERAASGSDALMRGEAPAAPAAEHGRASPVAAQVQGMLVSQAWRDLNGGERRTALARAARAVGAGPASAATWLQFFKIVLRAALPRRGRP